MTKHRNPPLEVAVAVRFTADEMKQIRAVAKQLGIPYSELVRRAVDAYIASDALATVMLDMDAVWSHLG